MPGENHRVPQNTLAGTSILGRFLKKGLKFTPDPSYRNLLSGSQRKLHPPRHGRGLSRGYHWQSVQSSPCPRRKGLGLPKPPHTQPRARKNHLLTKRPSLWQHPAMLGERENQFCLTRAALSTRGAQGRFLSVVQFITPSYEHSTRKRH